MMQNHGSWGKQLKQQPLHYLNGDRHQIWCFAKWLFQTFLEGSANDCQKHRQEDRNLHPSAGNAWLFVVNTWIKGVLKEVTSVLCWNEQKSEVKPLYLMRFMLCCGILLWDFVWDLTELQMKFFFLLPDFPSSLSPLGWIMSLASHLFMMSISFSFCYGGLVRPVPKLSALSNIFVLCEQVD